MDDREALERLKRRDAGGLEALVTKYQVRALRAAYLVTRDRSLAEEVVQEAFLGCTSVFCGRLMLAPPG